MISFYLLRIGEIGVLIESNISMFNFIQKDIFQDQENEKKY